MGHSEGMTTSREALGVGGRGVGQVLPFRGEGGPLGCGAAGFQARSHLELGWEQPWPTGRNFVQVGSGTEWENSLPEGSHPTVALAMGPSRKFFLKVATDDPRGGLCPKGGSGKVWPGMRVLGVRMWEGPRVTLWLVGRLRPVG